MSKPELHSPPVRRIVTGHDLNGKAKIMIDSPAINQKFPRPGAVATLIWATDSTPADMPIGEDFEDMGALILGTAPPANGTRFTINDFPPGIGGTMHRTETIDYVIVLSGEMEMELDDAKVVLKAGDAMVQRGTNHSWTNRGTETARVAFILVDAKPLGIDNPITGAANVGPGGDKP